MNHKLFSLTVLAVAALVAGCDKEPTTAQQIDNVKAETKAAAQDMKDYTYAQKAEFTASMKAQLAAINDDLDKLSAKVEKSSDAVKAEAKPKLQALRDQADRLNKHLEEVQNSTESNWDAIKRETRRAYDSLKDSLQQSRQWVSDKIAP